MKCVEVVEEEDAGIADGTEESATEARARGCEECVVLSAGNEGNSEDKTAGVGRVETVVTGAILVGVAGCKEERED